MSRDILHWLTGVAVGLVLLWIVGLALTGNKRHCRHVIASVESCRADERCRLTREDYVRLARCEELR
jgi:hypothetical protein